MSYIRNFINFTVTLNKHEPMKKLYYLSAAVVILTAILIACTAEVTTIPMEVSLNYSKVTIMPGETVVLLPGITPDEAAI